MRRVVSVVVTLVVAFAALGAVAVALAFAGLVPVAASNHHLPLIEWYLETASDHAVDRGGEKAAPPADASSPEMLRIGLIHYQEMCVTCHGAPGIEPSDIARGLYPHPPLLERHERARIGPTYWIVKNGVRDTGMPAFGGTHSDRDLWAIAAFAVAMPHLSPAEYQRQAAAAGVATSASQRMEEAEEAAMKRLGEGAEHEEGEATSGASAAAAAETPPPAPTATAHGFG